MTQTDSLSKVYKDKIEGAKKEKFTFLLVGRTGVGKSSAVNLLMDKEVAPVGDWTPTTMQVKPYPGEAFGIKFNFIDTPGLCDDVEEMENDQVYLDRIENSISGEEIDCLWFVTRLNDSRVTFAEKRAIRLITRAFGEEIWDRAVIIFTFANQIPREKYNEVYGRRNNLIQEEIMRCMDSDVDSRVPAVAIDNMAKETVDGQWLGKLYVMVLGRTANHGFLPFLLATANRLEFPSQNNQPALVTRSTAPIKLNKAEVEDVEESLVNNLLTSGVVAATAGTAMFSIGAAIASPIGAAIGGVAGASVGALLSRLRLRV